MKTLKLLSAGLFLSGLMACAQSKDVPQVVKDAFAKKYPSASSVKWDKENDSEWEAEFKVDKVEYSANFGIDGTWMETEHEIMISQIPQNVKDALREAYPDYKLKESEISETATGLIYVFEIKKGDSKLEVGIDSNGKIVKKEMKKANDEEDTD